MIVCLGSKSKIGSYICNKDHSIIKLNRNELDLTQAKETEKKLAKILNKNSTVLFLATVNRLRKGLKRNFLDNISMAQNVGEVAKKTGARVVFLSSADIYGLNPPKPIDNKTKPFPECPYSKSKLMAEKTLRKLLPQQKLLILRIPGIYGIPNDFDSTITKLIELVKNDRPIVLSNFGRTTRDYLFVDDLISAFYHFQKTNFWGTWNLATGHSLRIVDYLNEICKELKLPAKAILDPKKQKRDYDLCYNLRNIKQHLPPGWPNKYWSCLKKACRISHKS